jgi:LmbE family N-acetylglucosaminyl deacetylase
MPTSTPDLLVFGAHPDDIEFGCGGVIAAETAAGRPAHFVVCSKGESATRGTPAIRAREARNAARILGASIEFANLGGDAHFEVQNRHVLTLARIIRRVRPAVVLAPSLEGNQHPDHSKLGLMVRDALRVARYGGVRELKALKPHACGALFWYAVTTEAEPAGNRVLVDVSAPQLLDTWRRSMEAHASQMATRNYVELQLTRARLNGLRSGTGHAIALFPADAPVVASLASLSRTARSF